MKKFALILLSLTAIYSCSKSEENYNHELMGTCWEREESVVYEYRTLCFGIDGIGRYSYKMVSITSESELHISELRYVYNKPNINITYQDGSLFGRGYIEDDKLFITEGHNSGVYTKWDR